MLLVLFSLEILQLILVLHADGDLDINADDEIELNSTLIDINGNVEISGTAVQQVFILLQQFLFFQTTQ